MSTKIFIVEDDKNIREMESYALKGAGFEVFEYANGQEFFEACKSTVPDLVVLDIMLPGADGMGILGQLRNQPKLKDIPVIMVSAKSTELDKVKALDTGADDYITKPFGVMEFLSRVRAALRRSVISEEQVSEKLTLGAIAMDDVRRTVQVNGQKCELTFKEYELLKYFLQNASVVLSRERIMDRVWGTDFAGESRTVDMHVKTLRQKLGSGGDLIKTVRNVGYKAEEGQQ